MITNFHEPHAGGVEALILALGIMWFFIHSDHCL